MSAHSHTIHIPPPERLGPGKFPISAIFAGLSIIGIILSVIGATTDYVQFAYSWFFAFYFFFTIALGSQYGIYSSSFGVPDQLIQALPYLITIAAVAGLVGRVRPPAADGIPYSRE